MKVSNLEQLAIAQAAYKALGAVVSTSSPDSLRAAVDRELRNDFETKGVDRYRMQVGGKGVGSLSVKIAPSSMFYAVDDADDAIAWLIDNPEYIEAYLLKNLQSVLKAIAPMLLEDGVVPDGCTPYTEPERFMGTTLTGCKVEDVAGALRLGLPQAIAAALTGEVPNAEPQALPEGGDA